MEPQQLHARAVAPKTPGASSTPSWEGLEEGEPCDWLSEPQPCPKGLEQDEQRRGTTAGLQGTSWGGGGARQGRGDGLENRVERSWLSEGAEAGARPRRGA